MRRFVVRGGITGLSGLAAGAGGGGGGMVNDAAKSETMTFTDVAAHAAIDGFPGNYFDIGWDYLLTPGYSQSVDNVSISDDGGGFCKFKTFSTITPAPGDKIQFLDYNATNENRMYVSDGTPITDPWITDIPFNGDSTGAIYFSQASDSNIRCLSSNDGTNPIYYQSSGDYATEPAYDAEQGINFNALYKFGLVSPLIIPSGGDATYLFEVTDNSAIAYGMFYISNYANIFIRNNGGLGSIDLTVSVDDDSWEYLVTPASLTGHYLLVVYLQGSNGAVQTIVPSDSFTKRTLSQNNGPFVAANFDSPMASDEGNGYSPDKWFRSMWYSPTIVPVAAIQRCSTWYNANRGVSL